MVPLRIVPTSFLQPSPAAEWFEFTDEPADLVSRRSLAWGRVVERAYNGCVRAG